MISVPLIIILLILVVFLETVVGYLFGMSLAIILSLLLLSRVKVPVYLAIFIPLSLSMDITNHIATGGTLFTIVSITLLFKLGQKYLPFEGNPFVKVGLIMVSFAVFHIVYLIVFHLSGNTLHAGIFNLGLISKAIKLGFVELLIYLSIEYVVDHIGTGRDTVLKLK